MGGGTLTHTSRALFSPMAPVEEQRSGVSCFSFMQGEMANGGGMTLKV